LSYDELGRRKVEDGRFSITYDYDANGNRQHVTVNNYRDGTPGKTDLWNTYDAMNRSLVADGTKDANGNIVIGVNQGHRMTYDTAGRVKTDASYGWGIVWTGSAWEYQQPDRADQHLRLRSDGRLYQTTRTQQGDNSSYMIDQRMYDDYGRLTRSGLKPIWPSLMTKEKMLISGMSCRTPAFHRCFRLRHTKRTRFTVLMYSAPFLIPPKMKTTRASQARPTTTTLQETLR
jgi:hypothetical protein